MRGVDWFCEECDASFRWFIWTNEDEFGTMQELKKPKTDEEWKEAELFTDFCMDRGEYYPVGEKGIELDEKPCEKCMKLIGVLP